MCEVLEVESLESVCMTRGFYSDDWLTENEVDYLSSLKAQKRRNQSRAARWMLKEIIAVQLGHEWKSVEICSANGQGNSLRPMIIVKGESKPWKCSISHSESHIAVGFNADMDFSFGVDLVSRKKFQNLSLNSWMTESEKGWLSRSSNSEHYHGLFWGIKEAAYKATNNGESFHPLRFEVIPRENKEFSIRSLTDSGELQSQATVRWAATEDYFLVTVDLTDNWCEVLK